MADNLVDVSEAEIQEYFDAAVKIAQEAGKVLKQQRFCIPYYLLMCETFPYAGVSISFMVSGWFCEEGGCGKKGVVR